MKKTLIAFFCLITLIILSGCTRELSEEQLKILIFQANSNMDYYSFNITSEINSTLHFEDLEELTDFDYVKIFTNIFYHGKMDLLNENAFINTTTIVHSELSEEEEIEESEYYYFNGTYYYKTLNKWMILEDSSINTAPNLDELMNLFEISSFEMLGQEKIGNKDYYVIKVHTSNPEYFFKELLDENLFFSVENDNGLLFENFSYIMWVNKKSFLIEKTQFSSEINMSLSLFGMIFETEYSIFNELIIYDVNIPVEINLPDEALSGKRPSESLFNLFI